MVDESRAVAPMIELVLRGDYITLDALLKTVGLAPSGGAAKTMVSDGRVCVDGTCELRKTRKLRAGQIVSMADARVRVVAAQQTTGAPR